MANEGWVMEAGDVKVIVEKSRKGRISIKAEVTPGKEEEVRQRIIKTQGFPDWVSLEFCLLHLLEQMADRMGSEILEVRGLD